MIIRADPADELLLTYEWADVLVAGVTLSSVEHTPPAPLERLAQVTDTANARSTAKVRGFVHGKVYNIPARAVLSNGEVIERALTIRGFND